MSALAQQQYILLAASMGDSQNVPCKRWLGVQSDCAYLVILHSTACLVFCRIHMHQHGMLLILWYLFAIASSSEEVLQSCLQDCHGLHIEPACLHTPEDT